MTTQWTLSLISGGQEYTFADDSDAMLLAADGLGSAPIELFTEQGPQQHGVSVVGSRLGPRKITLVILYKMPSSEWAARRNEIIRVFTAAGKMVQLRFTSGTIVRQIDCFTSGIVELPLDRDLIPRGQRVIVEFFCPDPTWYNPDGVLTTFAIENTTGTTVPLVVPLHVGSSIINITRDIQYNGTWWAFPVITARGPLTNLVIVNETTGDKLDFTGTRIERGDSYVIDCRYGHKTVTRTSDNANRIRDLTADSDLTTFAVAPHPWAANGTNSISVRAREATLGSSVRFQFYPRFLGV